MTDHETASSPLGITEHERGGFRVLALAGDIDIETSRTLREHLVTELTRGDERVVVDLSAVPFMDSSGLGALVGGWQIVRDRGEFRIAGANEVVHRVLTLTGMEDVFSLHPTVEAAVSA